MDYYTINTAHTDPEKQTAQDDQSRKQNKAIDAIYTMCNGTVQKDVINSFLFIAELQVVMMNIQIRRENIKEDSREPFDTAVQFLYDWLKSAQPDDADLSKDIVADSLAKYMDGVTYRRIGHRAKEPETIPTETTPEEVPEAVQEALETITGGTLASQTFSEVFSKSYIPMYNSPALDTFFYLPTSSAQFEKIFRIDSQTGNAIYTDTAKQTTWTIRGYERFIDGSGSSMLKLLDAAMCLLTANNVYKGTPTHTTIEIPLYEYAELVGRSIKPEYKPGMNPNERAREEKNAHAKKSHFITEIEYDLDSLECLKIKAKKTGGSHKAEYANFAIIGPNHMVMNDTIRIPFTEEAAKYLCKQFVASMPDKLFKVDIRNNPNTYPIARGIALQRTKYKNMTVGTNNTLRVQTLLGYAPAIPTPDEVRSRGQRNWRTKSKKPLETVLNSLVETEFISGWQYQDPKTKQTYTSDEANSLSDNDWINLNVVFNSLDQSDLLEIKAIHDSKAAEKKAARAAKKALEDKPAKS